MTILYFGSYNPDYSRNRVLISGLRKNGVKVIECNVRKGGFRSFPPLFLKYLKLKVPYDLMVVGFPGQEVMFLAKILTRKPIVFDAFTSHYGGYIIDRQYFSKKSWRAKYYRFLDRWSCKLADQVLLDTETHINFFIREFKLPRNKFIKVWVGTDTDIFYPREAKKDVSGFFVHFHGYFIPLQGVDIIVKAAKLLENDGINFRLIGDGQTFKEVQKLAKTLAVKNVEFLPPVSYETLPDYIIQADVCLGIFGDSPKTESVIPNKIYESLAMRKPVITANTSAIQELFTDGLNIFLCRKASPESLAEKILFVRNQPDITQRAAQEGYRLFEEKLKEKILGAELIKDINEKTTLRK